MITIYKYPIAEIDEDVTLTLVPWDFKVVHFESQNNVLTLWAEVVTSDHVRSKTFRIFGTGWEIPDNYHYQATTQTESGYVWHLYEKKE